MILKEIKIGLLSEGLEGRGMCETLFPENNPDLKVANWQRGFVAEQGLVDAPLFGGIEAIRKKLRVGERTNANRAYSLRSAWNGMSLSLFKEMETAATGSPATALVVVPKLSVNEVQDLERCEELIRQHIASYFEGAKALKRIHDQLLYREFGTFEAYAMERWGFGRVYAYRLVRAAGIVEDILRPLGLDPLPQNESQVRPLTILPAEIIPKAWREVIRRAKKTRLTANVVTEVVAGFHEPSKAEKECLTFAQKEIQRLLLEAADAVARNDFAGALHQIGGAQVRIDVEAARLRRDRPEE